MMPSITIRDSHCLPLYQRDSVKMQWRRSIEEHPGLTIRLVLLLLSIAAILAALPATARSQQLSFSEGLSGTVAGVTSGQPGPTYVRPTQATMAGNYLFDAFGPYPVVGAAFAAGINQISNAPPEWKQGMGGYGKRFGSDFAIAAVATTTRYGLAEALKEDTLYYRCECSGFVPRHRSNHK